MHRKSRASNSHLDHFLPPLKKINATDRFPCFCCFDHPKDKLECKECNGNGWISGTHPMVQFAEDFIEKRIGGMMEN